MKKTVLVFLSLICAAGLVFAAKSATDDPLFAPGNITAQADLGSGFIFGIDISGGAEYGLGSFKIAEKIPLTYGVAGRVGYAGWTIGSYNYGDLALGALGTVHLSWKDVLPDIKWLSKVESYVGLGLGLSFHNETYTSNNGLKFSGAGIEGNNWYITPKIALNLEEGYFGYGYGGWGRFGVLFKL